MKHRKVTTMLKNIDSIMADDIAQYAIFNNTDNDTQKHQNIVYLIQAYTKSVTNQTNKEITEFLKI